MEVPLSLFPSLTSDEARIFDDNPNPEGLKALVSKLKKVRTATTARPDSLQMCCSKTIGKNMHRFLALDTLTKGHSDNNPFANLPKTLAIFLAYSCKFYKQSSNRSELLCFFLQLLNPQMTEYTGNKFQCRNEGHDALRQSMHAPTIFKHLLQNCPKIETIKINSYVWVDLQVLLNVRPIDFFEMMALQWPNLTSLSFSHGSDQDLANSDVVMEMISKHLPKLSDLDICLSIKTLTNEGVKHFSQMHKLKHLSLGLSSEGKITNVVHAVGQLPAIETLSIGSTAFVEQYGQLYPNKKITLEYFSWETDLKCVWPECLKLKSLSIVWSRPRSIVLDTGKYENILAGNCSPESFHYEGTSLEVIYAFVKKLGPAGLTDLRITFNNDEPLDVLKVLSFCSKLESIHIESFNIVQDSEFTVRGEQFQVCDSFKIRARRNSDEGHPVISELLRKYLLNSRKFLRKMEVIYKMCDVDDIFWALNQEKHTCMDQINEIRIHNFQHRDQIPPDTENKGFKIALLLAMRSPNLKKVVLTYFSTVQEMPKWYRDFFKKLKISLRVRSPTFRGFDSDTFSDEDVYSDDSWCEEDSNYYYDYVS